MLRSQLKCGYHRSTLGRVTQRYGDVAQPLLVSGAVDGAAREPGIELGLIPREQLQQRHIIQAVPHCEIRLDCGLSKAIPRAHQLTVVAAEIGRASWRE